MTTRVCSTPGCPTILTDGTTRCTTHTSRTPDPRPSPSDRGYDSKWRRNSARYLAAHPVCVLCGRPATHSDHHPLSRRELLALGVEHPDAWSRLRALCTSCHNRKSARDQA
jgi:5-methylcytosine-specific restriction protein A